MWPFFKIKGKQSFKEYVLPAVFHANVLNKDNLSMMKKCSNFDVFG